MNKTADYGLFERMDFKHYLYAYSFRDFQFDKFLNDFDFLENILIEKDDRLYN